VLGIVGLVLLVVLGVFVYNQINPTRIAGNPTAQIETPTPTPLRTLPTDGAACDTETKLVPKDWPAQLTEDFSSNQNDWPIGVSSGSGYVYEFSFGDNDYVGTGNWTRDGLWHTAIPNNSRPATQDFYAAVELTLDEGPEMLDYGITFRSQPTATGGRFGSHMRVGLQGNGSSVQLVRTENGDHQNFEWPMLTKLDPSEKHRLSVMGLGNLVYMWLDGQCIGTWTDPRDNVPTGGIGLYFALLQGSPAAATVRFDNFEVRAP
jgi:hypothetical protein